MTRSSRTEAGRNSQIAALQEKLDISENGKDPNAIKGALLYQNYPNPFPMDTEIKMDLPETATQAKLILYNLEGKELRTVPINSHGKTSVKMSRNDLGDGMYLYALIVDGKVIDTKRLVITK